MNLSEHFDNKEFADRVTGFIPKVHPKLIASLEIVRRITGPLMIVGPYRDPKHNNEVGGAPHSTHMTDPLEGVDIACSGMHPIDLVGAILQAPDFVNGGIGVYPHHVHVDVRSTGRQRWISLTEG